MACECDDWLVVQHEFVFAHSTAQIAFQRQAADGGIMQTLIQDFDARPALGFRPVHGEVGVTQGDTDAGGGINVLPFDH